MDGGVAIVRWTGKGSARDLKVSTASILSGLGLKSDLRLVGGSLVVSGADPMGIASALDRTPGVLWIAVGTEGPLGGSSALLAGKFLKEADSFSVIAESTIGAASDASGEATSSILGAVHGSKVDTTSPKWVFRVAVDARGAQVGIQLREGPGGVPVGRERAICLVSGGMHSAVVAWQSLLSGFRVTLVHVKVSDRALRRVAALYVELLHRVGEKGVELLVVEGSASAWALATKGSGVEARWFSGSHSGGPDSPNWTRTAEAPLFLLSEAQFSEIADSLAFDGVDDESASESAGKGRPTSWHFSGWANSVAEVIEGLRRRRPRPS